MKYKRYTSADKLGRAWLDQKIQSPSIAGRSGGYKIIADADTIWNGDKTQVLVRRNRNLNLVIAMQRGSASLGKSALACINKATEIPAIYKWNYSHSAGSTRTLVSARVVPTPVVFIPNVNDDNLSSCDLATLQPIVLASSIEHLKTLIRGYRCYSPGKYRYTYTEDAWNDEVEILKAVGLTMPKEYEEKKVVAIATRRLRSGVYHK
jgi:hypothetical protein